jgi:hypothetical protein
MFRQMKEHLRSLCDSQGEAARVKRLPFYIISVYLNLIYGGNLPYHISDTVKHCNALIIDPYSGDIGFSALLLDAERSNCRSHSPFRNFDNIRASLEIFNLIDRPNTISYMLIKDFQNNVFAVPNRLTPRLVNFKIVAKS